MIVVVDYGMGNLGSVVNMIEYLGHEVAATSKPSEIEGASRLILPGVGAFDAGMRNLTQSGIRPALDHAVLEKGIPILGVCLGMHLMTEGSEEGASRGLGWFRAETKRIPAAPHLKVPHMGWNTVEFAREDPLTTGLSDDARFYFVHSYAVEVRRQSEVVMYASHGIRFAAALRRDHIFAVQFHPEKSHRFGEKILRNFLESPC